MAAETELTKYICLFHSRDHAASAIRDLESAGFSRGALTVINGADTSTNSTSATGAGSSTGYGNRSASDFDGTGSSATTTRDNAYSAGAYGSESTYGGSSDLSTLGVPERDQKHLQDGLNSGGVVIGLEAEGDRADEIERIFHKHTAAKIDETTDERAGYVAPMAAAVPARAAAATTESAVIPVVDEELIVGKREVERGGVRVFRRIVEEPVSESVSLREEHVNVQRRPVDRPVTDADMRVGDQTIELTETAEEAVVAKTARVVEEVRVGKESSEHTETVRDSVRHTEVDIEPVEGVETTTTPRQTY